MEPVVLPAPVAEALAAWLDVHDEVAPGVIEGLYLVGSLVLYDWTPRSDIDVIAVVADPSDPDLFEGLAAAHAEVRKRGGVAIDGPYVAWGDLVVPPMPLHRPWVVDGDYRVDGDCGELTPVVWYTLATYGVAVRGEPADRLGVYVDIGDRRSYVRENLQSYWRGAGSVSVRNSTPTRRVSPPMGQCSNGWRSGSHGCSTRGRPGT